MKFRIVHRHTELTYPYLVQCEKKFLWWKWWDTPSPSHYRWFFLTEEDAHEAIRKVNTVVWEGEISKIKPLQIP